MFTSHTPCGGRAVMAAGLIFLCCAGPAAAQHQGAGTLPFRNPSLPLDQRVDDLVSRLTMEEKAAQLVNQTAAIPRLQIPAYNWWNEALHGLVTGNVTVFPQVIGLGSTFNPPLIKQMSTVISTEARARYNQSLQQPTAPHAPAAGRGGATTTRPLTTKMSKMTSADARPRYNHALQQQQAAPRRGAGLDFWAP